VPKNFSLRARYAGKIKRSGKQRRPIILKKGERRFAYNPVGVGSKPPKSDLKEYIEGRLDKIQQKKPEDDEVASIDMGLDNLFAIATMMGDAALIKGGHFREKAEIGAAQATIDILENRGRGLWKRFHDRYLGAWFKHQERLKHLYRAAVRFVAEWLYARGVRRICSGYPYMAGHGDGNKCNTKILWCSKDACRLYEALKKRGIELHIIIVFEHRTGRGFPICCIEHEGERIHRGLYICERAVKKLNTDLNAAVNIARRAGYEAMIKRIESYRVIHSGVKPLNPSLREVGRDPTVKHST